MPQLQFGDFAPQLIWLAITFTVLYLVLSKVAIPDIQHVLDERKKRIGGDLQSAVAARQLAESENTRYQESIASAKAQAQAAFRNRREKLDLELSQKRTQLDNDLAAKAKESERDIDTFLKKSSEQLQDATVDVVKVIVQDLATVEITTSEAEQALLQIAKR